jgi:hypothetical protein
VNAIEGLKCPVQELGKNLWRSSGASQERGMPRYSPSLRKSQARRPPTPAQIAQTRQDSIIILRQPSSSMPRSLQSTTILCFVLHRTSHSTFCCTPLQPTRASSPPVRLSCGTDTHTFCLDRRLISSAHRVYGTASRVVITPCRALLGQPDDQGINFSP